MKIEPHPPLISVKQESRLKCQGCVRSRRSGTNSLHGRLFYLHQNEALNARPSTAPRKLRDKGHTFGANAGGPIRKDRTFFYLGYSAQRLPQDAFNTNSTPSLRMRAGDFGQVNRTVRDPLTGTPFAGNIIPASRINPTALRFQQTYVPVPNFGGPDLLAGNLRWTHPFAIDIRQADIGTVRVDHKLSSANTLAGKLSFARWDYTLPGLWPGMPWTRLRHQWTGMISDTHVFGSGVVSEVRWGIHRESWQDGFAFVGSQVTSQLGLPAPAAGLAPDTPGFPTINITGFNAFQARGTLGDWIYRPMVFSNSTTWAKGRHVAKFGGSYRQFFNYNGGISTDSFGNYAFNGSQTGDAYGDFLLGLPFTSTRLNPLLKRKRYTSEWGFFAQDSFKVNSRLTLEYGLRWELYRPGKYEDGLQFNWDPATGNVIIPQEAAQAVRPIYPANIRVVTGKVLYDSDKRNFAPRFGFAYRPSGTSVIRGGWGIFNEYRGYDAYVVTGGPFELSETFVQEMRNGVPLLQFPSAFPSAGSGNPPSQSVQGYPTNPNNGYIHQFNLSLEKEIRNVGFRLSYLGSRGHQLRYAMNINKPPASLTPFTPARRPYSQFVNTVYNFEGGNTKYDALQFQVTRKMSDLMIDFHWTWAHNMNDMLNLQDPYQHRFYNRDFTPRMRAVSTVAYTLPVGRGKKLGPNMHVAADKILGGWTVNWLGYFSTGNYFSPTFSGADPSNTNTFGGLPDRVANGNLPASGRKLTRWFDASAFAAPPAGRFGNSGVNVLEGPGLNTQHISLVKRFKIGESLATDLMLAGSNIFNHPNYTFPANNISVPSQVGVITNLYGTFSGGSGARRIPPV
ncbi:MAG: TonB-dependent receptor [Acidobacteria bacterium]|nr:TonB-dependent receptor [Acidobacteriota bacterium]